MNRIQDIIFAIVAVAFAIAFWTMVIYAGMTGLASL